MAPASGTEAPGSRRRADLAGVNCTSIHKPVLEDRFDDEPDSLLDDTVLDRRYAHLRGTRASRRSRLCRLRRRGPQFPIALRDVHSFDGLRLVRALPQRRRQLRQVLVCLRREPQISPACLRQGALPIHAHPAEGG